MTNNLVLVGKKCGMTRVFDGERSVPVTVVYVGPMRIVQDKTVDNDGYSAYKVAYGSGNASKMNKPTQGTYKTANVEAGEGFKEFRVEQADEGKFNVGDTITVDSFAEVKFIDVQAKSKGKGFAGVVKRHNFKTQDATHGNSLAHRAPGSIGQNQTPGRVFKGKKMAGHMGDELVTVQNLELVKVDAEKNILLIKGAVPGSKTATVFVKKAVKKQEGK